MLAMKSANNNPLTVLLAIGVVLTCAAFLGFGCNDVEPVQVCGAPTELNETKAMIGGFEGVDLLLVVDNTMVEEQELLAEQIYSLVNSLTDPLYDSNWGSVSNLRIAVTTSDMGLSWGGNAYSSDDGWPGGVLF